LRYVCGAVALHEKFDEVMMKKTLVEVVGVEVGVGWWDGLPGHIDPDRVPVLTDVVEIKEKPARGGLDGKDGGPYYLPLIMAL
jgi:hypothetical protein